MALPKPEPELKVLTGDEAWAFFDAEARERMHMSGADFLARWDAGEFGDTEGPNHSDLIALSMLIPFVRPCEPPPAS